MWTVTYERHYLNLFHKTSTLRATSRFTAELFYAWWSFCYLMCEFPVKLISIQFEENGVVSLNSRRGKVEKFEELVKLKRFRKYGTTKTSG